MIYSIVPAEVLWSGGEGAEEAALQEVPLPGGRGGRLLLRRDRSGCLCVHRLISSEPRDYWDPRFQPGTPHFGLS